MALNSKQKEQADLWRQSILDEQYAEQSKDKALYLWKYLRNIGDTMNPEVEQRLSKIRKLVDEIKNILEE